MKILRVLLMFALSVFSIVTFAQAVDINTATAEQLDKGVKGIGPAKAAEIVKYREASGPYKWTIWPRCPVSRRRCYKNCWLITRAC